LFDGEALEGPIYCLYTPPPEVAMAAGGINGAPALPQDAVMGGAEMNGVGSGLAHGMAVPGQDMGMSMGGMNGASGLGGFQGDAFGVTNGGVAPQQQQQQQSQQDQQQDEPQLIE
jgi:hypothetical protein